jgi:hypothetical protein
MITALQLLRGELLTTVGSSLGLRTMFVFEGYAMVSPGAICVTFAIRHTVVVLNEALAPFHM